MTKVVVIIQARMSSTRLPGKVLKPVLGQPMLARQIERVKRAQTLDQIVVATTTNPLDTPIYRLAGQLDIPSYRGSATNVLDRFYQTAKRYRADIIIRLAGDCPLIDPQIINRAVTTFNSGNYDYLSNVHLRSFPRGMDVEVFNFKALTTAWQKARSAYNREHVTAYIYARPQRFKLQALLAPRAWRRPELRLTVDEPTDLKLIRQIYQRLYPRKPNFNLQDIIILLDQHPKLTTINQAVTQKTSPHQRLA